MPIGFNDIPGNLRVPFVYVEFDASRAAPTGRAFRALLIGQQLSTGAAEDLAPVRIAGVGDAVAAFGRGSMLALMAETYRRGDATGELWGIALPAGSSAVARVVTLTISGAATAAGTLVVYIAGRRVAVGVTSGAAANAVAASLREAIGAVTGLPAAATGSGADVVLTARQPGAAAGDLDVRANHLPGETLPPGLAVAVAQTTAGATDPSDDDLEGAFDALGDEAFDVIAMPYTGAALMMALETELAARWGPQRQIEGVAFAAFRGADHTVAQATTYGSGRNSPHVSVMDVANSPTPVYEWAAAVAAQVARHGAIDPARPFQTLPLPGVLASEIASRRTLVEANTLLHDGISTHAVDRAGVVRIQRLVTTYQTSAAGVADTAYLNVNTPLTLGWLRRDFRETLLRKYPRHKLADDDARFAPGQPVMTPKLGRAEAVARFRAWEEQGLVEGFDQFKADLVVTRNAADRDRLDWLLSPDLVNQLRISGAQIQFLL